MRQLSIVVAIATSACVTHHVSKVGPFVKNITAQPQGLAVDSCVVQVETSRDYTWWWLDDTTDVDREISDGPCWRTVMPMGGR